MGYLTELLNVRPALASTPQDWFGDLFRTALRPRGGTSTGWSPAMEVAETVEAYLLRAEIPGIDPSEVEITLVGDTLTLKGEKKREAKEGEEATTYGERSFGTFERSFTFCAPVESNEIEAEAKNGVLCIRVAKAKESLPRKVAIKTR